MINQSPFFQQMETYSKNLNGRVALPECTDSRVMQAANFLLEGRKIKELVFFSSREVGLDLAKSLGCHHILENESRLVWAHGENFQQATYEYLSNRLGSKRHSEETLRELAKDPLYQAGMMLQNDQVDVALAGAIAPTSHVIRAALKTVGLAPSASCLSGSFILERGNSVVLFADCGVNIAPDEAALLSIAEESVRYWQSLPFLARTEPRVAFLSFSTHGSAKHTSAEKMANVCRQFQKRHPRIKSDGELQFDAAFDESVAKTKAPQSSVAGHANIFIFPDLNAGNIAYKITQRLAGFQAYGPLLQGLSKAYCDLSRGCSVHDIVACSYINLCRSKYLREEHKQNI